MTPQQLEILNKSITRGLSPLCVPEPLRLSEWADKNFYLCAESSGTEGPWVTLPYQRAPMDSLSNDDIKTFTWQKSARIGYTKIIVAATGYFIEHKKRNGVIWQPVDDDAESFVKDEIEPAIRDVRVWREKAKFDPEKRSRDNTLSKKRFIGSTLDVLGGKSAKNYRRLTKDFAVYDELDGFDDDIEGKEGGATSLGDKRLTTSPFPKSIRGSTPTISGSSQIEKSLSDADMVFRRYLPCPHCHTPQALSWKNFKWDDNDAKTARYICEECKGAIFYRDMPEMDEAGHWQTEAGEWIDENDNVFRDINNNIIDPPRHIGFHIWAAYSYDLSWIDLVYEFIDANRKVKNGDKADLKTFVNTRLGETWTEDAETVEGNLLERRRESYQAEVPDGVLVLVASVDVQGDRLEGSVEGYGLGEESWAIDYFRLYGDLSKDVIWKKLHEKIQTTYQKANEQVMDIRLVCIDSGGHYTDEVYKFAKKYGPHWIIPTKGSSLSGQPIANFPRTKNKKNGTYLTIVGTDTAKELIYNRYKNDEPGPGFCHYPFAEWADAEYFKQATAEEKQKKYRKGFVYYEWTLPAGTRNEVLDLKVLNLVAIRILQQHKGLSLAKLAKGKPSVQELTPPQKVVRDIVKKRRRSVGQTGNFATRFKRKI